MNNKFVIIYQFNLFYQIMKEIEHDLNFDVIEVLDNDELNNRIKVLENYLIVTNKINLGYPNQLILDKLPLKIFKIIEKLNIHFLKKKFNDQSQIIVKQYTINLNSREINLKNKKLKLTEKEIHTIIYLSKAAKPIAASELQNNVWGYQSDLETHTVETHIYRLRKKFLNFFNDRTFIISERNGYKI
tara:strand:+ start:40 stop:600 length:561 start_codon:yes stop_codon:yes gene_type:complete